MQGRQKFEQALFVAIDLEKFIPRNHRLRKIDRVLDIGFVRELTKDLYSGQNGRPSIDPVTFFRMQVIKFLFEISSDRQLCTEIHVNLAYRWFLRLSLEDKVPDHSSLTKIRGRLGEEVFKSVFERIVEQCQNAGLVNGKQMLTDATLIEANASLNSMVKSEDLGKSKEQLKAKRIKQAKARQRLGKGYEREKHSAKTHTGRTDPEATIVKRSGYKKHLYYKSHCTIDGAKRIITDCHVTTGSTHECTMFAGRLNYVTTRFNLKPEEWLADRGYGHRPTYEFLRTKGIRSYIPLRDKKLGRGRHAPTEGFRYDKKNDRYICPKGHPMLPHTPEKGFTRYAIKNEACQTCPLRTKCLGNLKLPNKRIQRSRYQTEFDAIHRRSGTENYRKKTRERSTKIEGVFGEDKVNHCLGRANYRGRSNMQIQVYLISMVHNLKRLANSALRGAFALLALLRLITVIDWRKIYLIDRWNTVAF